jgi:hypothetical protein
VIPSTECSHTEKYYHTICKKVHIVWYDMPTSFIIISCSSSNFICACIILRTIALYLVDLLRTFSGSTKSVVPLYILSVRIAQWSFMQSWTYQTYINVGTSLVVHHFGSFRCHICKSILQTLFYGNRPFESHFMSMSCPTRKYNIVHTCH